MHVLFDFEIDKSIPHVDNDFICELTREFFIEKLTPIEAEINAAVGKGNSWMVIISVVDDILSTIPINVPMHLLHKITECITPAEFDEFQDIVVEKFGLHTLN